MDRRRPVPLTRREVLGAALTLPAAALVAFPRASAAADGAPALPATPPCDDGDEPTPRTGEGPYFTPHSPERTSFLEPGVEGARIVVTGRVLSTACRPVPGALLDFWHADPDGLYDNRGFRLRGHQRTDAQGRYRLETIVPGGYDRRTRHFHVKVQAPGRPVLTTQLFFPEEPRNARDRLFEPALLMAVEDGAGGAKRASFDFVLDLVT